MAGLVARGEEQATEGGQRHHGQRPRQVAQGQEAGTTDCTELHKR